MQERIPDRPERRLFMGQAAMALAAVCLGGCVEANYMPPDGLAPDTLGMVTRTEGGGARVSRLDRDGLAAKAGLKRGDIIWLINGQVAPAFFASHPDYSGQLTLTMQDRRILVVPQASWTARTLRR